MQIQSSQDQLHPELICFSSSQVTVSSYFLEADFQVVLWLLLIVRERLVDQKLLFYVDLRETWRLLCRFFC